MAVQLAQAVAVAGHARIGQAADLSRPPPRDGRQPRRRHRGRCAATAARQARAPASDRSVAAVRGRRSGPDAPSMRCGHGFELASDPDDSAAIVAAKEKTLAALNRAGIAARPLVGACWTSGAPAGSGTMAPPRPATVPRTVRPPARHGGDASRDERATGSSSTRPSLAARYRFLHWPLAFPEVFSDEDGHDLPGAGSTPSWAIRRGTWCAATAATPTLGPGAGSRRGGSSASSATPASIESKAGRTSTDISSSSSARCSSRDRAAASASCCRLASSRMPGAAPLRRHLFDRADVDSIAGLDNRDGIFPIHRSLRFVLLTATAGRPTSGPRAGSGLPARG